MAVSRGFHRRRVAADTSRVPPGQYVTADYPVLSAGPTPHTPLADWTFTIRGETSQPVSWTWDELRALPSESVTADIHCVTKWTKLDTAWTGVSVETLLGDVETSADFVMAFCDGGYTTFSRQMDTRPTSPALGPWPDILDGEGDYPETSAYRFSQAAQPVLHSLANGLQETQQNELLLGLLSAPYILPLAPDNVDQFLRYARQHLDHVIRLRRSDRGTGAEWTAFPAADFQPARQARRMDSRERRAAHCPHLASRAGVPG